MVFGRPVTDWAPLAETQRAAIRMGHGSRCEQTGLLYMTVPAWIEWGEPQPEATPAREAYCSRRPAR